MNLCNNLTIIIITYNSSSMIKSCLDSVDLKLFKTIIVDNASSDDTCEIVVKYFPHLQIIKNPKNIGFGRASNIGLKNCNSDFALLLNVDARIESRDIIQTLKIMTDNPNIALAGNLVYNCKFQNGEIKNIEPCPKNIDQLHSKIGYDEKFYLDRFITGAGMFMNMKIMRKLGFFDEGFFLYCEDNEICKRVKNHKFNTAIIKNTKLIHIGGTSSNISGEEVKKIYWHKFGWSKLYYTQKVHNKFFAQLKAIRMIAHFLMKISKQYLKNRQILLNDYQGYRGCIDYLKGYGAFDENDTARG
ncbi:MAG: glycosyltransferase family 2 protein [Alphaproteobacteria bacterium]|nr:glycosyltransferase family 2 protein [Alphaproteobacteria bacterium]